MLNIGGLNEGFVLDHIEAGKAMMIYNNLGLDKLDCCVAIIKNARSNKMGKKDIIKIEGGLDLVDLDVLGFIDRSNKPCFAKLFNIWSKNPIPVSISDSPLPSKSIDSWISVSLVVRSMCAARRGIFTSSAVSAAFSLRPL